MMEVGGLNNCKHVSEHSQSTGITFVGWIYCFYALWENFIDVLYLKNGDMNLNAWLQKMRWWTCWSAGLNN